MADKPITFSGPMVCALLDERKGQTRRFAGWQDLQVDELPKPRFAVGDRLYVREAWKVQEVFDHYAPVNPTRGGPVLQQKDCALRYLADDPTDLWLGKHRQAMHMPRWASRLWLGVTDVRLERVKDISYTDAVSEGVYAAAVYAGKVKSWLPHSEMRDRFFETPQGAFFALLNSLHGPDFVDRNPWVYAYSFTRHRGNLDDHR